MKYIVTIEDYYYVPGEDGDFDEIVTAENKTEVNSLQEVWEKCTNFINEYEAVEAVDYAGCAIELISNMDTNDFNSKDLYYTPRHNLYVETIK